MPGIGRWAGRGDDVEGEGEVVGEVSRVMWRLPVWAVGSVGWGEGEGEDDKGGRW